MQRYLKIPKRASYMMKKRKFDAIITLDGGKNALY